jgi:hypothetical protein
MTAPPAAAAVPSTPGPVPPPVAGAPAGSSVLVAPKLLVAIPVGKEVRVPVGLSVPEAVPVGKAVCVQLQEEEAEHEGVAVAVEVAVAVAVEVAVAVAVDVPVAVPVGETLVVVQLVVGMGVQEGVAVAVVVVVLVAVAVAVDVAVAVAVWAGVQLDVLATATPPIGPVNAIKGIEISRVAVPIARPTSPALWSFSQLLCRDRRTIVTIP